MRVTGIIVAAIGIVILMFTGVMAMSSQTAAAGGADLLWPTAVGVVAVICGGLILAFGGRGYFVARSPAIRN
jgi:uncharacterized membrane protein YGL010W